MKKFMGGLGLAAVLAASIAAAPGFAATPIVGGAKMLPSKTIVENASQAKNLTTLVAAVKAAGLVDTLSGAGPFTVFAPTNAAFSKLPAATVPTLLKPENKQKLASILTYHVVSGRLSAADLVAKVKQGGGSAQLTTVEGEPLTVKLARGGVTVTDAKGDVSRVTKADVFQSNGVVHVVNTVLLPN